VAAHKLVYLLAASHSGSTLLALLLGTHPRLVTAGELKLTSLGNLDRYRCSCGEPLQACPFWTRVRKDMDARGHALDFAEPGTDVRSGATPYELRLLRPLHRGPWAERLRDAALMVSPSWRRRLPRMQAKNAALVGCVLEASGRDAVVDSSKTGLRLKYLLRNPDLEVRVVRLVRDGRAVALTYIDPARFADATDPSKRDGGSGGDRAAQRIPMADAAREWRRSNEEAEAVLAGVPKSRQIEARYEELCRDTEGTLGRIFTFLGLDPLPISRPRTEHVVGNGVRFDGAVEVKLDERWRTTLSADELRTFDEVAGDLNRRYGYV
jgi:hypothetical protein